ncbi:uncharacterized protein LOC143637125 [Bidens hawaiensis]|uniref:uncharacterized protein LOC143637125 n=1 Tax=Bidens hawaiensis TaxID=980011 RepID=UPI00404AD068
MAIDLYSDNSGGMTASPRISFSYDLSQSDTVPVEQLLRSFSSSNVDFNFCVNENSDHHHAADELFSGGKMLPTEVKNSTATATATVTVTDTDTDTPQPRRTENEKLRSPEILPAEEDELKRQNSKSFWGFKRSSSCGNGYARSLCPITLLSRSHSTGSSSSSIASKRSAVSVSSKDGLNQKSRSFQKPASVSQKPPLRKNGYGYGNGTASNGIRVNPVLNLGFGSLFSSNSKNKSKK